MAKNIQSSRAEYGVRLTEAEYATKLGPVTLIVTSGVARLQDWLTPEQAMELGAALSAAGLAAEQEPADVLDASVRLVAAADRLDAALGQGRR